MIQNTSCACFERNIAHCLRKANRVLTNIYDQSLSECGIKITQFSLLRVVDDEGEVTSRKLQDLLILDQTTLSRSLKPLLRDNYLEVRIGEDQRQRHLRLTVEGKKLLESAEKSWSLAQERLTDILGPERIKQLFAVGKAVVELIE